MQLVLSVPPSDVGWTYATWAGSAHVPSGRHAAEPGHSACARQARHVRSSPHAGVAPLHAPAWSGVHCTHVPEPMTSHTPSGAAHPSFDVHAIGPASSAQLSLGFAPGQ
jgi:hypothetical protein